MRLAKPLVRLLPEPAPPTAAVLRCHDVVVLTPEVRTFVFAPEDSGPVRHVAGQYLTLTVEVEGRWMSRNYTISSPPTRPYLLDITVKREAQGTVSRWLHDHLTPGMTITATLPHGEFTLSHHAADRYLLLAGGVGITPFLSMLRACHDLRGGVQAVLVHNTRGPEHLVARPELEALAASESWFTYVPVCDHVDRTNGWHGLTGRLDGRTLLDVAPDVGDCEVLVCGPPAYVDAALALLDDVGVSPSRCHVESFTPATQEPPPQVPVASTSTVPSLRVSFARSGRFVQCPPGSSILAAALEAGIPVPFSCGEGLCGTCKSTLLEGRVDMRHQGGIRPREIAQNKILLCCSTPLEDLVIDV